MTVSPKIVCVSVLAAVSAVFLPINVAAQNAQIRHIGVANSGGVTEIRIETSKRLMPLTQVITDPDRLVIDFPDALPAAELHRVAVNQGEVKGVRTSLLSARPPMTRVVIDLKSAQDFRLVPTATAITVRLLGSAPPLINPSAVAKSESKPESTSAPKAEPRHEVVTAPVTPAPSPVAAAPPRPPVSASAGPAEPAATPLISKSAVVASAKRPKITIERTSTENARPSLSTAAVIKPAIEPMDTAPAPPPAPASSVPAQIRKVSLLKSGGAMEFEIETSERVVPATQLITGPDRLVLDFPGSFPGPQLRSLRVNQGEVKGVRAALLSNNPPVTRIVLDLKSPQEFQLFPSTRSVVVKLPSSTTPVHTAPSASEPSVQVASAVPPAPEPPPKKVTVTFQNGQLHIVSEKGSLADVLNEVRLQTGAEIAIPAGAEQEQVVTTIGPAVPRTAMSELLNGSRYNFIIVGTDADPNQLERVVLTPKGVIDASDAPPPSSSPDPVPVAQAAPPARAVRSLRRNAMPMAPPQPTQVPPTDDAQPQGDSNPPPDTTPQPGDPQPPPN
jgi:hypothetical protein